MLYTPTPDTLYHPPPHHIDPLGYSRLAIITGCSSGIGLATTQLFLSHQFQVVGLDIAPFDYDLLRVEDHGRFHFHLGDLTLPGQIEEGVRIAHHFGYVFPPSPPRFPPFVLSLMLVLAGELMCWSM